MCYYLLRCLCAYLWDNGKGVKSKSKPAWNIGSGSLWGEILSVHPWFNTYFCRILTCYVSFKRGCIFFSSQKKKWRNKMIFCFWGLLFLLLEEGRVELNQTLSFWSITLFVKFFCYQECLIMLVCLFFSYSFFLLFLKCIVHTEHSWGYSDLCGYVGISSSLPLMSLISSF